MSTTLTDNDSVVVTRFWGGTARGMMVQVYDKRTGLSHEREATEVEKKFTPVGAPG